MKSMDENKRTPDEEQTGAVGTLPPVTEQEQAERSSGLDQSAEDEIPAGPEEETSPDAELPPEQIAPAEEDVPSGQELSERSSSESAPEQTGRAARRGKTAQPDVPDGRRAAGPEEEVPASNRRTYALLITAIAAVVLILLAFFYFFMASHYTGRFPARTTINGVDVSGMTVDRAKAAVEDAIQTYTLTIVERGGVTETITAEEIGLVYEDDGEIDRLLDVYNPSLWLLNNFRREDLTAEMSSTYDEALAQEVIESLDCFDPAKAEAPQDACIVDDGTQFVVQPAQEGNTLRETPAEQAIRTALEEGVTELDLDAEGLYQQPQLEEETADLQSQADRLNGYLAAEITFDFGDDRLEVVNADVIRTWVGMDESGTYDIVYDLAFEYVKTQLAYQYDTFGLTHVFTAHNGDTVTLKGGDYGWCIARNDTTEKLVAAVKAGSVETIEPEYQYSAKNRGINDIGGTYIEISISEQTMWCYEDGVCIVETPVVTGNINKGNGTPYGSVWAIDGMKKDAVLGTIETMGYASPVKYWIPFTGNVGIHDADGWRSSYGGTIYLTNGSHGCVNTPLDAMRQIYNAVEIGTAVVVYDETDQQKLAESDPDSLTAPETDESWNWDD